MRLAFQALILILACCATCALVGSASAADFSADVIRTEMNQRTTGKLYVSGNKIRRDTKVGSLTQTIIIDADKKLVWQFTSKSKIYSQEKGTGQEAKDPAQLNLLRAIADAKPMGKQTVSGQTCTKTVYTMKDKSGTVTVWVSDTLNWPIKTSANFGPKSSVLELRNIKSGAQPATLFTIPKGYKKAPTIKFKFKPTQKPTTKKVN